MDVDELSDNDVRSRSVSPTETVRPGANERQQNSDDSENEEKKETKETKKKKPKGPVRRMLINEDILVGAQGMTKLQDLVKDFQFRGKRQEKADLNRVLNILEQWVHAMHPKHPFDQCLERIETLGMKKKKVKVVLRKIRMGMMTSEEINPVIQLDDEPLDIGDIEEEMEQYQHQPQSEDVTEETNNSAFPTSDEEQEIQLASMHNVPSTTEPSNEDQEFPTPEEEYEFLQFQEQSKHNEEDNFPTPEEMQS